ncbi:MAG TPA: hypothetical protein PK957_05170 [Candidatus Dojkabacteria bacterium]|nr:hypothetical protein [Candidatus Dojkabacteria bacterium]HQF36331.1 hypothetical protein [Candidatus Dojkabacteria bacterium]
MNSRNQVDKSIELLNNAYPKDKVIISDIKFSRVLENDFVIDLMVFPLFFSLMFGIFSILGFLVVDLSTLSVGLLISLIFLGFSLLILSDIIKKALVKPQLILTSKLLYIVKASKIERYRFKAILKDAFVNDSYILLKYRPSFTKLSPIVINTKGTNNEEIWNSINKIIWGNTFSVLHKPRYQIVSKFNQPIVSIVMISLIGLSWIMVGSLFTYGGYSCRYSSSCSEYVANSMLFVGFLGLCFTIIGLYIELKFGIGKIIKGFYQYDFYDNSMVITTKRSKRVVSYDIVKSVSKITNRFGYLNLRITASYRRYRRTGIGPDHLFIYSRKRKGLDEIRRFVIEKKKICTQIP